MRGVKCGAWTLLQRVPHGTLSYFAIASARFMIKVVSFPWNKDLGENRQKRLFRLFSLDRFGVSDSA